MTEAVSTIHGERGAQQLPAIRRLYGTMKQYRGLAMAVARPALLVFLAALLILVLLPAALGAQAGAIR
jgi:hypothetical protein